VRAAAGLLIPLPAATHLLAVTAYDADDFHTLLTERGTTPVIWPIRHAGTCRPSTSMATGDAT
jgi:hypothetical protein